MSHLDGKLIYRIEQQHTHVEWLRFVKQLHREVPRSMEPEAHLIADNSAPHKHAKVEARLHKHKRFHMHFRPTSSSWMKRVERFFADLAQDCLRDGSFAGAKDLKDSIVAYSEQRNRTPKPHRWKASGAEIPAKIQRARQALQQRAS